MVDGAPLWPLCVVSGSGQPTLVNGPNDGHVMRSRHVSTSSRDAHIPQISADNSKAVYCRC